MFRHLALVTLLLGPCLAAHADVYRWVDPQGHVQFSDRWVPGSELVKTDKAKQNHNAGTPRQSAAQSTLAASNSAIADQKAQANAVATVQQEVAKNRAEDCKNATERYDKAIKARRIFKTAADGSKQYISDAEADAYSAQSLLDKNAACGTQAK